jgi:hypothetical protein
MYDYTSSTKQIAIMQELLAAHPALLTRDELEREFEDPVAVDDALGYFQRMGLVHSIDDTYFWATRAAVAAEELVT